MSITSPSSLILLVFLHGGVFSALAPFNFPFLSTVTRNMPITTTDATDNVEPVFTIARSTVTFIISERAVDDGKSPELFSLPAVLVLRGGGSHLDGVLQQRLGLVDFTLVICSDQTVQRLVHTLI